jgi:sterol desaturase/sphingolipid hydroxylase (fatty acid hydroxylase superfamily)
MDISTVVAVGGDDPSSTPVGTQGTTGVQGPADGCRVELGSGPCPLGITAVVAAHGAPRGTGPASPSRRRATPATLAPVPVDPTVVATPFFFGSMEAERRVLRRRAEVRGPSPADYERADTTTSLTMGVLSLVSPFLLGAAVRRFTPGRGRLGRALVGTVVVAVAVTTAADQVERRGGPVARRRARAAASVGGPIAVAGGIVAVGTTVAERTTATRMWRSGRRHDLGGGVVGWAAAILGWDFVYYWNHRLMHEVRWLWAHHVVHHSSERYNLSTALRQPVVEPLGVYVPYGLLSRVGVRPGLVFQARGINLLYQYWIHTDTIRSLGAAEEALNTPSHHRVHHGSNRRYLDRNHGSILIVWDRLFGTFQREEEPVAYGLTRNIETHDPVKVVGHELADVVRDIARSTTWRDRLSYALRGPGWAYARRSQEAPSVG